MNFSRITPAPGSPEANIAETKKVFNSFLSDSNVTGEDPMASLAEANPKLMMNLLAMDGQDLTGCLSNCSNKGKCAINADNKFVCECLQYYVGDTCNRDSR